ncbi:MAG: DNA-protecting protein DprA, partial [Betaproteobacteria bacterium]|nr:DNA-protecting protein DprA [Betaproteobacteria bacterium]
VGDIAALCVAVLVVQARLQSGALSTAHAAADLGKQVFAIPGSIDDPRSKGCHQLIRDGASLTERIEDIYRELPWLHNALQAKRSEPEDLPQPHKTQQQPALAALLQQLGYEAFDVHQLAQSLQISYESALHQSLRWELEGLLRRESNGRYLLRSL